MADIQYNGPYYFPVDPKAPRAAPPSAEGTLLPFAVIHRTRACWSFGPLEICADYSNGGIDFEVKLLGQRIGGGRLDQDHAQASVGADVEIAKAGVTLTADFANRQLVIEGEACVRNWLGQWECSRFREVLLRW